MNKWTWLAIVAFIGILGGGYFFFSLPNSRPGAIKLGGEGDGKAPEQMDVEDFDAMDEAADPNGDNTYDLLDDPDAATRPPAPAGADRKNTANGAGPSDQAPGNGLPPSAATSGSAPGETPGIDGVETIDDDGEGGETVKDPLVIEDNDVSIEAAKQKNSGAMPSVPSAPAAPKAPH